MSGMRTILSAVIALIAYVLQLYGVDFNDVLADTGLDVEKLLGMADQSVNAILVVGGIVSAIVFRIKAKTTVTGKPLASPGDLHAHWVVSMLALLLIMIMAGCAAPVARDTSDMTPTERQVASIGDGMVTAYVSVTQTRKLTSQLLEEGLISVQAARQAQEHLNEARDALDAARVLLHGSTPNVAQARGRLDIANSALSAARALLASRRDTGATP